MSERFGILLAGGLGTRLFPITRTVNKHLLPVYNKPQIYYSLVILMRAGLREIAIVSTPTTTPVLQESLGDGSEWGLDISYVVQPEPKGIAQAILLCGDLIKNRPVTLMLGDNLFLTDEMAPYLEEALARKQGASVFAVPVDDPERFGIVTLDANGRATDLVEKPKNPASNMAVTGLYFYDSDALELTAGLTPSARGELEITDLNRAYMDRQSLYVESLPADITWLDCGNPDSLVEASQTIKELESKRNSLIACPEELALEMGFVDRAGYEALLAAMPKTQYRAYLESLLAGKSAA
ncbi:MAG: sugar phosphate nucleotidyltransferase [Kiloniellales bacterium]